MSSLKEDYEITTRLLGDVTAENESLRETVRKAQALGNNLIEMRPQHPWSCDECEALGELVDVLDEALEALGPPK